MSDWREISQQQNQELSKELLERQGIINGLNLQVTEAEATRLNLEWKLGEATAALTDVRRERDLLAEALRELRPSAASEEWHAEYGQVLFRAFRERDEARAERDELAAEAVELTHRHAEGHKSCDDDYRNLALKCESFRKRWHEGISKRLADRVRVQPLLDTARAWRAARTDFGATRMEAEHDVLWAATEQLEAAVDALGAEVGTPDAHRYLSTACQHGLHGQCRQVCKFCEVGCGCDCGHPVREEVQAPQLASAEQLARLFHETYERLAPQHSYETRKASAKPWADVPENNKALMIATCREVLAHLGGELDACRAELAEAEAAVERKIGELMHWCAINLGNSHLHREIRRILLVADDEYPWQLAADTPHTVLAEDHPPCPNHNAFGRPCIFPKHGDEQVCRFPVTAGAA